MRHFRFSWLLLVLAACSTPRPIPPPLDVLPPEVFGEAHYVSFTSADELAAWLRYGRPDGPAISAHRGGHGGAFPENALVTFEQSLRAAPALLETDVRLTRDSVLVLLHDETLDRTTTGAGRLDALALTEVRALRLRTDAGLPTDVPLPTLAEALAWAEDRAVFTLDVKRDVPPAVLVQAIREAGAEDRVVVITYTPDEVATYLRLAPDLNLSISAMSAQELEAVLALPGFDPRRAIAFVGVGRVPPGVVERLHGLGIRAMAGVFGEDEARLRQGDRGLIEALRAEGVDVIATGAVEAAAER